jgi:hypothetical protein
LFFAGTGAAAAFGTIWSNSQLTRNERPEEPMRLAGRQIGVIIAALLASAGLGHTQTPTNPAQTPTNPGVPATTRTVNLTLEQRHVIRELVKDLKIGQAPVDAKVSAGDDVPDKVDLHPIPPLIGQKVPQIKSHRFYVTQLQIVIVDPEDHKVVEVIE